MVKKSNRSNGYQHLFTEQSYSHEMMAGFSISQGLGDEIDPEDKERLLDLKIEFHKEFWRLAEDNLTPRQLEVIKLLAQGYTQIEIAKQLNVNQSSITKSVNGNCDYRNGKKIYGGAKKKLKRLAEKDSVIQSIMTQIAEINSQYDG